MLGHTTVDIINVLGCINSDKKVKSCNFNIDISRQFCNSALLMSGGDAGNSTFTTVV